MWWFTGSVYVVVYRWLYVVVYRCGGFTGSVYVCGGLQVVCMWWVLQVVCMWWFTGSLYVVVYRCVYVVVYR